jgi:uncharacterized protein YegP (UPF0339 family)
VVVKLFERRGDGSYYSEPKYIFRPSVNEKGEYEVPFDYNNETIFVKGDYKVEYASISNTNAVRSGSYLARITDNCSEILPVIVQETVEITPEGKITVRTGGLSEVYIVVLVLTLSLASFGYWRLRRKDVQAWEVFGR